MKGEPLKLLSTKYFTKHRILNEQIEHPKVEGFEDDELVWCKIDSESKLSKRNASGMRMYHVWCVTEDGKKIIMLTLDMAYANLSNPIKLKNDPVKPNAELLNKLLNKVKKESNRLIDIRKHQAATIQNGKQSKSKSGYAVYTYNHSIPMKLTSAKATLLKLESGDKFKVKRTDTDKNELIVQKDSANSFVIDDLRLCMLICRSSL
jgi:hypothetical protein